MLKNMNHIWYSKASEKSLFYLNMNVNPQFYQNMYLVWVKIKWLGRRRAKKGRKINGLHETAAIADAAASPCRASLTFTSSKIPGLYEKIWSRFLLQISQIGIRDIHIECSKLFKLNLYFYVSRQSRPFWAVLKML